MSTQPQSGWLTIRQAAAALGVSELTVRRRIKDRKVAFRLEGGKYYVNLDLPVPAARTAERKVSPDALRVEPEHVSEPEPDPGSGAMSALLPELSRLAEQAGRASALQEQVEALEERCAAMQRDLVALSTRNGWLESQVQEREKQVLQLADENRRTAWWRRIFG